MEMGPRDDLQQLPTLVRLLVCGSEAGTGLRGGQGDGPSLDPGRRKVLTVLVLSFPFSYRDQDPGYRRARGSEEKGDGLFRWGGWGGEQTGRGSRW